MSRDTERIMTAEDPGKIKYFSERHLTIFDEVSQLAEIIVNEGDLNKIDKMYQIRFINFEGESW